MKRFKVTDPNGQEHFRTSKSKHYCFAVLARPRYDVALKRASVLHKMDGENWRYCKEASEGETSPSPNERDMERFKEIASRYSSEEEAMEGRRQERIEKVNGGDFSSWEAVSWSSRKDLADSYCSREQARGHEAIVVEVE